jgi:hypothetical protein
MPARSKDQKLGLGAALDLENTYHPLDLAQGLSPSASQSLLSPSSLLVLLARLVSKRAQRVVRLLVAALMVLCFVTRGLR